MTSRSQKYVDCTACAKTGRHASGGKCYQCNGKGIMALKDRLRKVYYEQRLKENPPAPKVCPRPRAYKDDTYDD